MIPSSTMSNTSSKAVSFATNNEGTSERSRLRYCCCRYGYYPLLCGGSHYCVSGCLLDVYSSMSCEFLKVDVDTDDDGTERGSVSIGIYFRQTGSGIFGEYIAEGCQRYPHEFEQDVIDNDNIWLATRYIGMISAIRLSGGISAFLSLRLIGEMLKFLFLDADICGTPLWYTQSTYCELGATSYFVMAACIVFFMGAVLVCISKPNEETPAIMSGDTQEEEDDEERRSIDDQQSTSTTEATVVVTNSAQRPPKPASPPRVQRPSPPACSEIVTCRIPIDP